MADNVFRKSPLELVLENQKTTSLPPQPEVPARERIKPVAPAKASAAREAQLMTAFTSAAEKYQVPLNVVMALAEQESRYNPVAVGSSTQWGKAKGVMQYLDSTAKGLGIDPFDPVQSINAAAKQLRERLDKGYSMEDAVKEHFAGPNRKMWGEKTDAYGREVLDRAVKIADRLGVQAPAADYSQQAPSPLTPQSQNDWSQERGLPEPFDLQPAAPQIQQAKADGTPMTTGEISKDDFLSATGKQLGNIPERFQNALGGILQKIGEGIDDTSLYAEASKAGIIKALQDSGEIIMKDGGGLTDTKIPYFKDGTFAGVSEVAQYLRQNADKFQSMISMDPNSITETGRGLSKSARESMTPVNPDGAAAKYGSMIIGSTAEMVPAILASLVTRNPATGMSMIGGQVYGQSYDTARNPSQGKQQLNPSQASEYALFQAAAEAIPEALPISVIIKPAANVFKGILKAGAAEAAQEGLTGAIQAGIDKGTIDPNMTWGEARQQIIDSVIVGAGAGASLKGGVEAGRALPEALRSKEEKIGRALDATVQSTQLPSTEVEAARAFDPSNAQVVQAQPTAQTGPLGRALARAPGLVVPPAAQPAPQQEAPAAETEPAPEQAPVQAAEATPAPAAEAPASTPFDDLLFENVVVDVGGDPMPGQVVGVDANGVMLKGQDGNQYLIPVQDIEQGVAKITPVQQAQATPEPAKAEQSKPAQQSTIEDMSPAQLHQRMAYLQDQAKDSGWTPLLMQERQLVTDTLATLRERELMQEREQDTTDPVAPNVPRTLAAKEFEQPEVTIDEADQASQAAPQERQPDPAGVPTAEVVPEARDAGQSGIPSGAPVAGIDTREVVPAGQPAAEQPTPLKQPVPEVLGSDGKPKWFGSKPKAVEFIDKKGLTDTHEVKKVGAKWEIHTKPQAQVQQQTDITDRPAPVVSGETVTAPVQAEASPIEQPSSKTGQLPAAKGVTETKTPAQEVGLTETELVDRDLLKEHAGRWKYRSAVGAGWFTANTKESAVARAQEAYRKAIAKGETVPTRDERAAQADAELFNDMDSRYGKMPMAELEAEYQRLGGVVSDLQQAGTGEFTGNGGRRTSAAVASEGARQTGEERLRLGAYMKMRQERGVEEPIKQEQPQAKSRNQISKEKAQRAIDRSVEAIGAKKGEKVQITGRVGYAADNTYTIEDIDSKGNVYLKSDSGKTSISLAEIQGAKLQGTTFTKVEGKAAEPSPQLAQQAVQKPEPTASANKVFTEDAAEKARALLRSKLGQLNSGVDPEVLQAGITLAGYHIEKGARTFAAYSKAMLEDLGDVVRPYLKSWYMGVKYDPRAAGFDGMSAAAEVESFNVDEVKLDEPSTPGAVEQDSAIPENAVGETAGRATGSGSLRESERAVDAAVAEGRVRPVDGSGVPATSPLDAGTPGDNRVPAENGQPGSETGVAGTSDPRGNRRGSGAGVQSERQADTRLRQKAQKRSAELTGRQKQQASADEVPVKLLDLDNIKATLPLLSGPQQNNVLKTERRFYEDGGKGKMLTDGTGTGKTYSGLGVAKRVTRRGGDVLIVSPAGVIPAWEAGAKDLGMTTHRLKSKQDGGKSGVSITSYQNFRDNQELMQRNFDLVIYDESHHLMANMNGDSTSAGTAHKAMTGHPDYERVRGSLAMQSEFDAYNADAKKEIDKLVEAGTDLMAAERQVYDKPKFKRRYEELTKQAAALSDKLAAEQKQKNTKVLFLSASPFAGHKSVFYTDGYLFDSKVGAKDSQAYNTGSPEAQYLVSNFGYRMRYNRVTQPGPEVDVGLLERDWADRMFQSGAMTGRKIELDHDYSREFVVVAPGVGEQIDKAFQAISWSDYPKLAQQLINWRKGGSDRQLTEALRAKATLDRIEQHLKMGRKVVVFHERQQLNIVNPFHFKAPDAQTEAELAKLKAAHPWIFDIDLSGLIAAPVAIGNRFGDRVAYFSGLNKTTRDKELAEFNRDGGTKDILVIQKDAGKEGLSAHDITGKHQRALMILNTPVSPSDAIQMEGRTYRHGLRSDAIIEYPTIQTSFEKTAYRETVSTRTSTAENLAMGSQARNLREAFREGYLDPSTEAPSDKQGKGGRQSDSASDGLSMFDRAKTYYFRRQKKTSRNKAAEGSDYFATPEPLGQKMVEWAQLEVGEKALEPSGGHGAISRWFPESTTNLALEPSPELVGELGIVTSGEVRQMRFEDLNVVNKFHAVVMNPPFGKGGATAIEHIGKAVDHLKDGGRVIAIYPKGPAADAKFDKWFEDKRGVYMVASIDLPAITFNRAGTSVATRILVLDKDTRGNNVSQGMVNRDLTGITDINELFARIKDMELPARPDVTVTGRDVNLAEEQVKNADGMDVWRATMTEFTNHGPAADIGLREVKKLAEKFGGEVVNDSDRFWKTTHFDFASEQDRERFFAGVLDASEAKKDTSTSERFSVGEQVGTAEQLTRDPLIKALVDAGKVVIHKDTSTLPSRRKDGVIGFTAKDGTIHVVEGRTAQSVLLHEAFHSGGQSLLGNKKWRNLMDRLEAMYKANKDSTGFWRNAVERVRNSGLPDGSRLAVEEFGAYAIENYDRAPDGVKKWVESVIGAIKAWLLQRFDIQAGDITAGQLRALARSALSSMNQPQVTEQLGELYSRGNTDGQFNRSLTSRTLTNAMPALLQTAPLDRMIEEMGKATPALKKYLTEKRLMDAYRNQLHQKHDELAQEWLRFNLKNKEAGKALSRVMHRSTIEQIDPTVDLQEQLEMRFNSGNPSWDSEDMNADAKAAEEAKAQETYDSLKAEFDALPPQAQHLYKVVRDSYKTQVKELDKILMDNLEKALDIAAQRAERKYNDEVEEIYASGLAGSERDAALAKAEKKLRNAQTKHRYNKSARMLLLRQQFERNRLAGPYFPLSRFGNYFVTAKDAEGKVVEFSRFESEGPQLEFAQQMRDQGLNVEVGFLSQTDQLKSKVDPAFVADIEEILNESEASDAVKDQIWQRYLESMPELSLRKKFIHRKGRAGFNEDALRAFASHMFHSDHQMARLKHAGQMQEHIEKAKQEARTATDPTRAAMVVNEVEQKNEFVMNPTGAQWAQNVAALGFTYYLATNPSSWIANLTQTPIIGAPILAAGIGGRNAMAQAAYQLGKASKDFAMGKGSIDGANVTAEEKQAMKYAYDLGVVDKSQAHDLAGVGENGSAYSPLRADIMKKIGWGFHQVERFNREVTYIAAYRMARAKGIDHKEAMEKAADLTWKAHFNYDNSNRPRVMQGDVAKMLLMFRNYQVNMLWRLFRDVHQSINATNPQERKEAMYQLGGVTGMMIMTAGLRGVWLYGIAMVIANALFGDDAEEQMKKGLVDAMGKDAAGVIMNGLPGHLTATELSGRIGMPDLWFRSPQEPLEGDELYFYMMEQLAGPLGGMAKNIITGASKMADGDVQRGLESMLPKGLIANSLKAYRYGTEGATTTKGDPIVENVGAADVVKQAIGFTPASIAEQYRANTAMKNKETELTDARRQLLNDYAKAHKAKDADAKAEAMAAIKEWNKENKDWAIFPKDLIQSLRARRQASIRNEGGIQINKKIESRIRGEAAPAIYQDE